MDRRSRTPTPCLWPGCPHLGMWRSYWCPEHHPVAIRKLRQAVDQARRQRIARAEPTSVDFDPVSHASALLGGTPTE